MKENINKLIDKVIVRLIMAWLLTAILFLLSSNKGFYSSGYASSFNFIMYICYMMLFFGSFCAMGYFKVFTWVETYGPMILITIYGYLCVDRNRSIIQIVGFIVALAIAVAYAVKKSRQFFDIKFKFTVISGYIILAILYVGVVGGITVFRYLTYRNSTYDIGIWAQMFYYMKTTLKPLTTCERDMLLSHFAVHFSPIYYIMLPFYYVFSSVITLQILQAVILISGLIPLYLLCKHLKLSNSATMAFGVIFALYPSLACGCYYDLHENAFLTPLILWLFYFIEKKNMKGIIIFTILTALVKEDAPVYLACIGLFVLLGKKDYIRGSVIFGFSVVYFLIVITLMDRYGLGVQSWRYSNMMSANSSGGLGDVIITFITNPAYAIGECVKSDRYEYIAQMLLPLGLLPFATKKVSRFILLIPFVLVGLVSDYTYQHSIFFQYTFGILAIFFYMAVVNYSEMADNSRRYLANIAICTAIIMLPAYTLSKTYYFDCYENERSQIEVLNDAMDMIPEDASVTASTFLVPHLAYRDTVYMYPSENTSEYIILDLRWNEISEADIVHIKVSKGYNEIYRKDNVVVILQEK